MLRKNIQSSTQHVTKSTSRAGGLMQKRVVVLCERQNRYRLKSQRMCLRGLPTTALRIKQNYLWIKSLAASSSVFKATLGNLKHKNVLCISPWRRCYAYVHWLLKCWVDCGIEESSASETTYSITRRAIHMHRKLLASACEFAMWAPACECAKNHLEVLSLSHALLTSLQAISLRASNSWLSFKSFANAGNRWYERCFLFPFHNITNWQRCLAFPLRISQFRCAKVLASFLVCVFKAFTAL